MAQDKRRMLVIGLLYPAFLGSLIYNPAEKVFNFYQRADVADAAKFVPAQHLDELFLIAVLGFHFVLDYLFVADEDPESKYNWPMLIADLVIVVMLFLSMQHVLRLSGAESAGWIVWFFLLVMKFAAFLWELVDASDGAWDKSKDVGTLTDVVFCFVYAIGMLVIPNVPWVLAAFVALDSVAYLAYRRRLRRHRVAALNNSLVIYED